jgi:membrane associated rhomboid family serine protease
LYRPDEIWIPVGQSADERGCTELALVLEARGIACRHDRGGEQWLLSVRTEDAAAAARELNAYRRENARGGSAVASPLAAVGGGWFGVASFVAVLLLIAVFAHELTFGIDWRAIGRMDAARLLAGEGWRALTALTLHADTIHLLGNVTFGALFTYFVGRYLGGGVGWMAILASGALGNLLNGWLTGPDHRSIGASTAVFGALGLLSAYTWRRGFPRGTTLRSRLAPVVAGIALLAYTGTAGQNTDLGAHLLGFAAGFLFGFAAAHLPLPTAPRVQLTAGAMAWLLVAGAWAWGILATA